MLGGFLAAIALELSALWLARQQAHSAPRGEVLSTVLLGVGLVPAGLVAIYCLRAAVVPWAHAARWVLALTLPPLAWLVYHAELDTRAALAQHRWTASVLYRSFGWFLSMASVIVFGELALFLSRRFARRRGGQSE
jgi:hypothetical protein